MYIGNTYRFALALFMFEALGRLGRLGRHHAVERAAAALVLREIESQENQGAQWRWEASYTQIYIKKHPKIATMTLAASQLSFSHPQKSHC